MSQWKIGGAKPPMIARYSTNVTAIKDYRTIFGLDCFEISTPKNINYAPEKVEAMINMSKIHSVDIGLHAEFYTSVLSSDDRSMGNAYRFLGNSLNYAMKLNCPVIVHPGGAKYNPHQQILTSIYKLDKVITLLNIDPSIIYLETMGKVNQFGDFPELIIISKILNTRICVDWAHLFARNMASHNLFSRKYVKSIIDFLENTSWSKEMYFHLSGMEYNSGGEKRHIPLEYSEIPWKMILDELGNSTLAGRIILESGYERATDAILVNHYING